MKILFINLLLVFSSLLCKGQDTITQGVKELMMISDHYKSINSLQMEISYKFYADTLYKNLLDSSTEKFISFNRRTYVNHLNTVSIISDSLVFFMDHQKKMAFVDRKPITSYQPVLNKMKDFFNQGRGYKRFDLGKDKIRYRILSDSLVYDWIDIYIDLKSKKLDRLIYKFADVNKRKEVSTIVIEFLNQRVGKEVQTSIFNLENYLIFSESMQINLLQAYKEYKFYNYVY